MVFVYLLALIVIFRMKLAVWSGYELRRFVGFESLIERLLSGSHFGIAEPLVTEHQIVMGLKVFRIYLEHLLKLRDCLVILPLAEEYLADLIQDHPVTRILGGGYA